MFNFLHTFEPQAIFVSFGSVSIYWYGLILSVAMLVAIIASVWLARFYQIRSEVIVDLAFWLILIGVIGARLYYVFLEWSYYKSNLWDIAKIWQGGLAIHGGILFGILVLVVFARRRGVDAWLLASIIVPATALAQAIGRWGNYFNQELYGMPTGAPWGIPIAEINRPAVFLQNEYFHPTFLYESLAVLIMAIFLYVAHFVAMKEKNNLKLNQKAIVLSYLIFYSVIRFVMEEFRIDEVPMVGLWRWPQILSAGIALASLAILVYSAIKQKRQVKLNQNI